MNRRTIVPWFTTRRMTASLKKEAKTEKGGEKESKEKERNSSTLSLSMYVLFLRSTVSISTLLSSSSGWRVLKWHLEAYLDIFMVAHAMLAFPPRFFSSFFGTVLVSENTCRISAAVSMIKFPLARGTPPFHFARCRQSLVLSSARKALPLQSRSLEAREFREKEFFFPAFLLLSKLPRSRGVRLSPSKYLPKQSVRLGNCSSIGYAPWLLEAGC